MSSRYSNRAQLLLVLLVSVFLFANISALAFVMFTPAAQKARVIFLLTIFIITLCTSLPIGFSLLRRMLRPYNQLVGEAKRARIGTLALDANASRDEAQFVLDTFKSVIAQLQQQQHALEELSARANARAVSAEEFSARIVASVPSGLLTFDARGATTLVNAPAQSLLELKGEACGQNLQTLLKHAPDLAELIERCLGTGQLYRREEVIATMMDGRTKRLGATIAPINPPSASEGRGVLCLLTDITEVTNLREQVALKRNLENLGEMAAGLSHEFKNALATLHGYAQLLQNIQQDEQGRAAAASLLQEVRSLADMITAFLNFARPQPLVLAEVSLRELIYECADELQKFYQSRRVELHIEGDFPKIRADETMLRQALLNLLRNAAEAIDETQTMRQVNVRGTLSTQATPFHARMVTIEISDTGRGISLTDLQRIFIPFFTTKAKGHGVGLALAHRVITEHGGTLTASNALKGGAIFTINFPLP